MTDNIVNFPGKPESPPIEVNDVTSFTWNFFMDDELIFDPNSEYLNTVGGPVLQDIQNDQLADVMNRIAQLSQQHPETTQFLLAQLTGIMNNMKTRLER